MILRPAIPADAARLAAILSDWIDETDWMPRLHTREEDAGFVAGLIDRMPVMTADAPGPVGFLARDGEDIVALYLAPEARGRGIGKALLDAAKGESARLALWTFVANEGARAFYAREGFVEDRRTGGENDEKLPDVRLVWERRR